LDKEKYEFHQIGLRAVTLENQMPDRLQALTRDQQDLDEGDCFKKIFAGVFGGAYYNRPHD